MSGEKGGFFWPAALSFLSLLYGAGVRSRLFCFRMGLFRSKRLPCAAISVGNLTAGGAGKTPMTIFLAGLVQEMGLKPAVLSRGYRGGAEKTGGAASDGTRILMSPEDSGDEPFMMARRLSGVPVMVGRDRFDSGVRAAGEFGADAAIFDDGFQRLDLKRDLDIVLIDGRHFLGNRRMLPRGFLREPVSSLFRAHAAVFTRVENLDGPGADPKDLWRRAGFDGPPPFPVFACSHVPRVMGRGKGDLGFRDPGFLKGRRALAFSGIASNSDFRDTLLGLGCEIADFRGFPDHHRYSDRELEDIRESARAAGADYICVTEKDHARISHRISHWGPWREKLAVIGVDISFGAAEGEFRRFVQKRLAAAMKKIGRAPGKKP